VSELSAADRERLLALALTGSDAGSFYADWILSEFDDLDDPTTRAAVQDYVSRADPSNWYAPQSAMQGVVIALSLIAKADLPLPAPVNGGSADPAWRASMTVIMGALAERSGLPIDRREVEGAWAVLVGEHRDFLAGLLTILRSLHRLHAEDHQVFELVLGAMPAAGVDALVWSVEHPDQVRSVSRVDLGLRNNLTDLLGRLGDGRAAEALRRFTDDPEIGEAAANAVRAIEARAGSTWRTPSTTPKP
jgi:hypothetical protein